MGRIVLFAVMAVGCQRQPPPLEPPLEQPGGRVVVLPAHLVLPETPVGSQSSAQFRVMNVGDGGLALTLVPPAPFSTTPAQLDLAPGDTVMVGLIFSPVAAGPANAELLIGDARLTVEAVAAVPTCTTSCDDGDACTDDSCVGTVCMHALKTCTASEPRCQTARCDRTLGCVVENVPDGTLTGADDCRVDQVDLCLGGQNGARSRPMSGRCFNRWLPAAIPPREGHAMAWDSGRKRVVSFGGKRVFQPDVDETWEYDGQGWLLRMPPMSPSPRSGHLMAHDDQRGRVVLFGGGLDGAPGGETWEWDGTTWLHHLPATSPSARQYSSMAYDRVRGRVVLFGGSPPLLDDTWEWDGVTWLRRSPSQSPAAGAGRVMAFDPMNNRVLLHGGSTAPFDWTWDGVNWTPLTPTTPELAGSLMTEAPGSHVMLLGVSRGPFPSPQTWEWTGAQWDRALGASPHLTMSAAAFDADRPRVVVMGGRNAANVTVNDTWEWDGTVWEQRSNVPSTRDQASVAWDSACRCVVLFGGYSATGSGTSYGETWEWRGAWQLRSPVTSPSPRYASAMAFDEARQRLVLFGGYPASADTWEWDGTDWRDVTPALPLVSPGARSHHRLVYDAARQRVLLFGGGGATGQLNDTWSWDGTTWTEVTPPTSPPVRVSPSLAYDATRQRVVLFGGKSGSQVLVTLSDLWEWDGASWLPQAPAGPAPQQASALFYEPWLGVVVLTGDNGPVDQWAWDGTSWTPRPWSSPPTRNQAVAAFDEVRRRLFVFDVNTAWHYYP